MCCGIGALNCRAMKSADKELKEEAQLKAADLGFEKVSMWACQESTVLHPISTVKFSEHGRASGAARYAPNLFESMDYSWTEKF
ncbi:hypothetical protein L596_009280 [Steinernema carpocapsae]|uniref:Uncharacterized protein n=1 Tax=Steinernema carpocapsae TaxID=34508 RepID=A0A4U5PEX4_STECR|nr:hypothetical protein L596_009280 [Steinernema carpocapsae]